MIFSLFGMKMLMNIWHENPTGDIHINTIEAIGLLVVFIRRA